MIDSITICVIVFVSLFALGLAFWPLHKQKYSLLIVPVLLGAACFGYWYWGSWQTQAEFLWRNERQHAAETLLPGIKNPQVLIEKLQKHLAAHPRSARGWYLLGRLYASQQLWEKSYQAFGKAYELNSHDDLIAVNYAQSLLTRENPHDEEAARKILKATLEEHPQQADALLLLALNAQHRHATEEALTYWRRLLLLVPESSPEAASIRKAIQELNNS